MRSRVTFTTIAVLLGLNLYVPARANEQSVPPTDQPTPPAVQRVQTLSPPTADEVQELRREIQQLREQIGLLRDQMSALRAVPAQALEPSVPAQATASQPSPEAAPQQPPPSVAPTRSQNLMNPAISAVFQMIGGTSVSHENDQTNRFDLSEAEIAFQSVVDPYAKVDMFLTFPSEGSPEVEEGYLTTLALPKSLQLKAGRFKSAFGKWNTLHDHAFFTVDRPKALTNFFGEESLTDDGLSLSFLIPNPWNLYVESATEIGTPSAGESFNSERRSLLYLEHLSGSFNTSLNSTFEVGLSAARGRTGPSDTLSQALGACGAPCSSLQTRDELVSAVEGIDLTYKWKPLRLNVYKSFLWQNELLRSRRSLDVLDAVAPVLAAGTISSLGGYSYIEWQLRKRWRIGARYDLTGFPDDRTAREWAGSAVVRFQPSEFQELRLQFMRTVRNSGAAARFDGEETDNQVFFEWIPVIGAHGAHKY
jgi:hypothetical protein